ncbi:putrescine transport ATP-binding protein PotG [Striga asiatica]|uniref:Putrescine transport ATP-binding protein PotG n=1 Tax=Striga asiatica TaxID=4170 RepID=A0A5A7NUH6_STRAF|nr:putrescine transport ATP-binding protein PotG [Striga asiatica]
MSVFSLLDNNCDKENIPVDSLSLQPAVPNPVVPSSKKRKSRTPLEDITNFLCPELAPSSEDGQLGPDASSLSIWACLAYKVSNRRKRVCTLNSRRSSPAAETLRKHFR